MTAIYLVTFVMSAVLICKWTLSHYDDDDDNGQLTKLPRPFRWIWGKGIGEAMERAREGKGTEEEGKEREEREKENGN